MMTYIKMITYIKMLTYIKNNVLFEGAILKCIFWGSNLFRIYGCQLVWLEKNVNIFLSKFSPQVKLLQYWLKMYNKLVAIKLGMWADAYT